MAIVIASDTLPPDRNGIALLAQRTGSLLAEREQVYLVGPAAHADKDSNVISLPVQRLRFGTADFVLPVFNLPGLKEVIRGSALVVAHTPGPVGLQSLFWARKYGVPSKLFIHNDLPRVFKYYFGTPLTRATSALIAKIFETLAEHFAGATIVPQSLIGPHRTAFRPRPPLAGREARASGSRLTIAYHGRVSREKALDSLVRAMAQSKLTEQSACLKLIGEGSGLPSLMSLAKRLRVSIEHIPWQTEPRGLLATADLFVLPSKVETYSLATLEALGCGLPVLARRVGDIPYAVEDRVNGLLFDTDKELVGLLQQVAGNPSLRQQLGAEAKARAVGTSLWQQFSNASMSAGFEHAPSRLEP